jgi:hypothetical protein
MPRLPALLLCLLLTRAACADDLDDLLTAIRGVKPAGAGSPAARAAWDKLVKKGPKALPRILQAMDTPDTVVANWLRTAFDEIADPELKAGGKRIPVAPLLAFARDRKRQGRARRLALEVVEKLRPGTRRAILRDGLDDPEFGFDAVAARLADLAKDKKLPKGKKLAAYRQAFSATRDLTQARTVAARLKDLGLRVSPADHFGFLRDWYVIGPFDARGSKGFKTTYPPQRKVDISAILEGKNGNKLRWKRFTVPETPAGRFPILVDLRKPLGEAEDAVAYAWTSFTAKAARKVDFRGSADDNFTVWVNGKRVFGFEEYRNGVRLDRHVFRVNLKAGVNTVLVKICQAPHDPNSPDPNWEFLLRITDTSGRGLTFPSALKPAK